MRRPKLPRTSDERSQLPPSPRVGFGAVSVIAFVVICACDSKAKGPPPIQECIDFAQIASRCLGNDLGEAAHLQFDKAPPDSTARESLRARCAEQHERLRKSCR